MKQVSCCSIARSASAVAAGVCTFAAVAWAAAGSIHVLVWRIPGLPYHLQTLYHVCMFVGSEEVFGDVGLVQCLQRYDTWGCYGIGVFCANAWRRTWAQLHSRDRAMKSYTVRSAVAGEAAGAQGSASLSKALQAGTWHMFGACACVHACSCTAPRGHVFVF